MAANPWDFTSAGDASAARSAPAENRRKQTLMTLLDALTELTKDGELSPDGAQEPSFEDDRDVPTVDEHLQKVGAETFHRFQRRINNLDKELRNFANAARQLGSSVGILSSTFHLRERLTVVAYLFHENAADLFPRKISHHTGGSLQKPAITIPHRRGKHKAPPHARSPFVLEPPDPEEFPRQIRLLAKGVMTFLQCLNEFPEFTDEAVNASISSFDGDLRYWASCLKAYEGQFRYPAVQRYLHDLTSEMGDHIESITTSLSMFIEIGVPTIRFAQKHGANNLLNLSTVATFFSAVTATTLQFSFEMTGTPLADAVNGFWFTSMVFSIAAAVNSLVGLTWKRAMYRSPGHRVPWWVLIWIKRSPLVFLVLSVACFSVGLVLFTYSSSQHHIVSTITTVFTGFSSFGLMAVSAWFASERWVYARHKGQKWLSDTLDDVWDRFLSMMPIAWMARQTNVLVHAINTNSSEMLGRARKLVRAFGRTARRLFSRGESSHLPTSVSGETITSSAHIEPPVSSAAFQRISTEPLSARSPTAASTSEILSEKDGSTVVPGTPTGTSVTSPVRTRWANMVRSVIMMQAASNLAQPRKGRAVSSLGGPDGARRKDTTQVPLRASRLAALVPRLRGLMPTEDISAHTALVRHLQFSPDGRLLATSSWDRTSVIFRVGEPFTHHRTLAHPTGFVSQVAWAPSGNLLLTKLTRSIKVWTETGVCTRTIDRYHSVQSICWLPGGEAFLSVEGGSVAKVDLTGKELEQYRFDRLKIHDVTVTPDGQRMLGVGTLLSSHDGLHPSKCRAEKQIISYNLERKEIENQVPVLHDIRDITLAKNGQFALVSYEFKAPPQLWKLEMVKVRAEPAADQTVTTAGTIMSSRLSLRHTYMPKFPVDFAGPSYFGGKDDQLVLCAAKAGDIHIWDRESGALLHHIRAQAYGGGDLTCIAWNPSADPFMFSTGSHDGAVRIWTTAQGGTTAPPSIIETGPDRSPRLSPRSATPLSQMSDSAQQFLEPDSFCAESPTQQDFTSAGSSADVATPRPSGESLSVPRTSGDSRTSSDGLLMPHASGDSLVPPPASKRAVAFSTPQTFSSLMGSGSGEPSRLSAVLEPPPPS